MSRLSLALLLLLALKVTAWAACPATGVVDHTAVLNWPRIGQSVTGATYRDEFCNLADAAEGRKTDFGHFSLRPAASVALATKLYVVDDCVSAACTAGTGSPGTKCVTRVKNDGSGWDVGPCDGSSSAATWSSLTAGTGTLSAAGSLHVGTGTVLDTSGTGTITANAFTGLLNVANGGTNQNTARKAFDALSPNFNIGDIAVFSTGSPNTNEHFPIGTVNGQVLTVDTTNTTFKMNWLTPTGGGGYSGIKINGGTTLTAQATANFVGNDVSGVNNGGASRTDITIGSDVMAKWGLTCDGSTNDSVKLQTAINTLNAATPSGGTIRVMGGKACALGGTVVPKSNVNIICEGGSSFKAVAPLTTAMFQQTGTSDNYVARDCTFDLGVWLVSLPGKWMPVRSSIS